MASLLDGIDLRTQLAGYNRLELLMFHLNGEQRYGINVFKVQEVIRRPPLVKIPHSHPCVCGVATMRGKTISVIDLALAVGQPPLADTEGGNIIITEYNRSTQGFLVRRVDRIVNIRWEDVMAPPSGLGGDIYLTAITRLDGGIVEMIDVEKVLGEIGSIPTEVSEDLRAAGDIDFAHHLVALVADDSTVARAQIQRTLEQMGMESVICTNGRETLDTLNRWVEENDPRLRRLAMVISDIEMPELDGYTLTSEIRKNPQLKHLYILLHTSLSGGFNEGLVKKVGANEFVPKFEPNDLANAVARRIRACVREQAVNA